MFRSRRSLSARQLWRRRCATPGRGQGEGAPPTPEEPHHALRPAALQLFKRLKDEQLWRLAEAVESKGRWDCGCVWFPPEGRSSKQSSGAAPCILLCKLYRWPDLRGAPELKRLPHCENYWRRGGEGTAVCCNPYHFTRLAAPESSAASPYKTRDTVQSALCNPLHPITNQETTYCNVRGIHESSAASPYKTRDTVQSALCNPLHPITNQETTYCNVRGIHESSAASPYKTRDTVQSALCNPLHPITNQETTYCNVRGIHDTTLSRGSHKDGHWCKVAYWEHRTRVGRLYNVTEPSVQIFHDLPKGSGFCLGLLGSEGRSERVRRTRKKIGQGLILSHEQGGVWVYNRSEHPVFINSPTLAPVSARGQSVHKLLPGYSIKVFDPQQAERVSRGSVLGEGPSDLHSVRISFAKGWGGRYSRQFITSCPCWLEILLSTPK